MNDRIDYGKMIDYYWNCFQLHSTQRMQMINYYITIEIVLIGAYFTLEYNNASLTWPQRIVSIAIIFFSLVFYLLDRRTVYFIKESESHLILIEDLFKEESYKLLKNINYNHNGSSFCISYSKIFFCVFIVIALFGIITLFR